MEADERQCRAYRCDQSTGGAIPDTPGDRAAKFRRRIGQILIGELLSPARRRRLAQPAALEREAGKEISRLARANRDPSETIWLLHSKNSFPNPYLVRYIPPDSAPQSQLEFKYHGD